MHVTRYLWRAFDAGHVDIEEVREAALLHGMNCQLCASEFEAARQGVKTIEVWPRDPDWRPTAQAQAQMEEILEVVSGDAFIEPEDLAAYRGKDLVIALIKETRKLKGAGRLREASRCAGAASMVATKESGEDVPTDFALLAGAEMVTCYQELEEGDGISEEEISATIEVGRELLDVVLEKPTAMDPYIAAACLYYRAMALDGLEDPMYRIVTLVESRAMFLVEGFEEEAQEVEDYLAELRRTSACLEPNDRFAILFPERG